MQTLEEKQAEMRERVLKARKPMTVAESQAAYHARIKAEVIKAYGGKCQCPGSCDITEHLFLTIDHIKNDGHLDRVSNSYTLYRRLLREGCPTDRYRLLCYNCNLGRSKRKDKRCPHEFSN